MSVGHAHALFLHGTGPVHRLASHTKVVAMLVFVAAVVATPREAFGAYLGYALLVLIAARSAGIPHSVLARRLVIEIPFVLFAVALPFIGGGERIDVAGLSLSREGLWGAWTIIAKGTLGLSASIILASTTTVTDILAGLDRLRTPRLITAIAGFMVRYLDVIVAEMRRMRVAMLSRGYDPRWFWQAKALATSAGALFIRSYERGERVYYAMTARGYAGHMPAIARPAASGVDWMRAMVVPLVAWVLAGLALAGVL